MNFEYFAQTDQGRVRRNNEDSVLIGKESQLVVLADGMGGYNAGEVASAMATSVVNIELGRWLLNRGSAAHAREVKRAIGMCVDNANRAIFDAANANPTYSGMGTTVVIGVFMDARVFVGHVGDSRCYRLRGATLRRLSRDHSWLHVQIDAGVISAEQAKFAPNKNLITRALGVEPSVLLEVNEFDAETGDLFLLCSDGLSDMVPDETLAGILQSVGSLEWKAARLVEAANANGGRDNISVILVQARTPHKGAGKRALVPRTGLAWRLIN